MPATREPDPDNAGGGSDKLYKDPPLMAEVFFESSSFCQW